ncbi:hypothetical protein [Brevundimonas bacteroides]|uniref:hypothetical protein n=1 Tax=Brevundimonas bacteroides TaxID=74311 RepID=UPI0004950A6B|nr:hypothetical protein [Brevundimonas bacteroides]
MREIIDAAAQKALGGPVPSTIKVKIDPALRVITMIGPMASGKTRIARAVPVEARRGWTCLTGTNDREIRRQFNNEWLADQPPAGRGKYLAD